MGLPRRGPQTDQFKIEILWDELTKDDLRGSYITSYYLQWDNGTNGVTWSDLQGYNTQYLQLDYITTFSTIIPGQDY